MRRKLWGETRSVLTHLTRFGVYAPDRARSRARHHHPAMGILLGALTGLATAWSSPADATEVTSIASAREQLNAGEFQTAVALADDMLNQIDTRFDRFSMSLLHPLQIKAEALYRLGQFTTALDLSARAQNIVRYNEGLHSLSQLPDMQRLAAIHAAAGDTESANGVEESAYELAIRNFSTNDLRLVPHLHRLADWYVDNGHPGEALILYRRSREIAQHHLPTSEASLSRSLAGITRAYLEQGFPHYLGVGASASAEGAAAVAAQREAAFQPSLSMANDMRDLVLPRLHIGQVVAHSAYLPGETAARDLVALRRDQHQRALQTGEDIEVAAQALAEATKALGDWYQLLGQAGKALNSYRAARSLATGTEVGEVDGFAMPELLYVPHPGPPDAGHLRGPRQALPGEVQLMVDVDNRGRVRHTRLVSSVPADLDTLQYVRAVRNAKYRPALGETGFVGVKGVPLQLRFDYLVSTRRPYAARNAGVVVNPEPQ